MDSARYCRDVESYLCRKNEGHLIRIVGPAFELVCGWASRQIPLSVVCRAIDQTVDRRAARESGRRPIRIEFCDADVLDLFDEWRRAVGVGGSDPEDDESVSRSSRRLSLAAHVERVIMGLTAWRGKAEVPVPLGDLAGRITRELDAARSTAKTARGEARQRLVTRLVDVDHELTAAVRETADASLRGALRAESEHALEPFRERMPPEAFQQAIEASTDRLLRDHLKLPPIVFE